MFINTFRYTPEDVDCKYCTDYSRHGCTNEGCPWLAERIEAGDVSYTEILVTTFAKCMSSNFRTHLCELIDDAPESFWVDDPHRNRFERLHTVLGYNKKRDTNRFIALLYLFTADENLFVRCGRCINRGGVEFSTVKLRGIETSDYILYRTAKSIYTCLDDFNLEDLEDSDNRDFSFRFIINALLIVRYGIAITRIKNNKCWITTRSFGFLRT